MMIGMPISYLIIFADAATPLVQELLGSYFDIPFRTVVVIGIGIAISYH